MRKTVKYGLVIVLCSFLTSCLKPENKFVRKGNRAYHHKKYDGAVDGYKRALDKKAGYFYADYNYGNAMYKKNEFNIADSIFSSISDTTLSADKVSAVFYNLGNTYLLHYLIDDSMLMKIEQEPQSIRNFIAKDSISKEMSGLISKSIDAYKKALRSNPANEDARYNLAYAQYLLPNAPKNDQQKKDNKQIVPTEFAKKLKVKADSLNRDYEFYNSDQVMDYGLRVDSTVKKFNDYIQRIKSINNLDTISEVQ